MRTRSRLWVLISCVGLLGCSGSVEKKPASPALDAGADDGAEGENGDGEAGDTTAPGDEVDVDGDGVPDGVAVDTDADGVADGVDTDGDGDIDEPLPVFGPDGGIYAPPDACPLPFPVDENGKVQCGDHTCACSDGTDNDGDSRPDLDDPECVASWDDDESSLATGIAGDNRDDACQDCFFDGNSGSGNDGCYLPSSCIAEGNDSSGQGRCASCEQSASCVSFCKAYTPNGCDCFGCCTVQLENGTTVDVALGNGCNIDGSNVEGCTQCVPNDSCVNTCGTCELCPGKTLADLPPECFSSGDGDGDGDGGTGAPPGPTCEDGETRCGAGLPSCPSGYACDFGCCVLLPVLL